jgi:tRNA(Ile)-lysidine synthase
MASTKKPRPSELFPRLTHFLSETVQPGQTLLLGLSGGLDSCVLLHLLVSAREHLSFHLKAVHVNHGFSPHASQWAEFCAALCAGYAVPFIAEVVHVPRDSGLGIEAAARNARYQALRQHEADALVLAHHRDDQAETVLLQLLRGSGVKGLAAMPAVSVQSSTQVSLQDRVLANDIPVLRPLLDVARAELAAYAGTHGLQWIEDESNLDLAYDRNFLRHHVFPQLEQRFPAARTTLARSAVHFAETVELMEEVASKDAALYVQDDALCIEGLRALSPARGRNLLRYWLGDHVSELPNTRRLYELYRQLLTSRQDGQLRVVLVGGEVRRYRDRAVFERETGVQPLHLAWHGETELQLAHGVLKFTRIQGQGLAASRIPQHLDIRSRAGGERFRPDAKRPTRSLRHLLQEAGMPPWERTALPLIYAGDRLALVPGIGVACDMQAMPEEEGWVIEWKRG